MKKIIRLTESELTHLIKRIIKENNDDPRMFHRYSKGGNPGIEKFFEEPLNDALARELEQQLENDEYANIDNPTNLGKGTRVMKIIFNNRKMTIDDFIDQVQEDAEEGICHIIDEYEYNNRALRSTLITIKTEEGPCKKKDTPKPTPVDPKPKDSKKCKYENIMLPKQVTNDVKRFQRYCKANDKYKAIYTDGTTSNCTDIDGIIGCCTKSCFALLEELR